MYTDKFDRCFQKLLVNEGGYAHLAGDSGGRTWYGVSERYQSAYFARIVDADAPEARLAIAKECYHKEYWTPMLCEEFTDRLAFRLFDTTVVAGRFVATKCLQRACALAGATLVVDGRMGPKTLAVARTLCERYERNLVGWMTCYVGDHFQRVAENPEQRKFLWGWGARLVEPGLPQGG